MTRRTIIVLATRIIAPITSRLMSVSHAIGPSSTGTARAGASEIARQASGESSTAHITMTPVTARRDGRTRG